MLQYYIYLDIVLTVILVLGLRLGFGIILYFVIGTLSNGRQKRSASIHTRRVVYVGVDATKHVLLPISSECTGLVVLQWFVLHLQLHSPRC